MHFFNLVFSVFFRYAQYFNDEELQKVNDFLSDASHNFEDYKKLIEYYHNLAGQIPIKIQKTAFTEYFEISYANLINTVADSLKSFKDALIDHLVTYYQNMSKQ